MLEIGTFVMVKWFTVENKSVSLKHDQLKELETEKVTYRAVGLVTDYTKDVLTILIYSTSKGEVMEFNINTESIIYIHRLQDMGALEC